MHGAPGVQNTKRLHLMRPHGQCGPADTHPRGHPLMGGDPPTTSSLGSLQGIRSRKEGTCGQGQSRIRAGRPADQFLPIAGGFLEEAALIVA